MFANILETCNTKMEFATIIRTRCTSYGNRPTVPLQRRNRADTCAKGNIRILVLGAKEVGKTSIVRRFIRLRCAEEFKSTSTEQHYIKTDKAVVELMDANDFLLPSLKRMAIKTASAFALVYAVDNAESFEYVRALRDEIIDIKGTNVPIVVVGNKVDVPTRKVHPVVADCMVTMDWGCPHVEASAKETKALADIFNTLLSYRKPKSMVPSRSERTKSSKHTNTCCVEEINQKDLLQPNDHDSLLHSSGCTKRKRVHSFSRYVLKKLFKS